MEKMVKKGKKRDRLLPRRYLSLRTTFQTVKSEGGTDLRTEVKCISANPSALRLMPSLRSKP